MMDAEGTPTSSEREPLVTTTAEQAPADAPQAFSKAPGTGVALVTGASSGIGKDTAHKLRALGYIVYGAARRTDRLQALTADGIRPLAMDVTDDASISSGVNRILEETGRIDVLVNNLEATTEGSAYADQIRAVAGAMRSESNNRRYSPPEVIARTVGRIVTARRPRTRYAVGFMAKPLIAARRVLPDRAFDQLIGAAFGFRR